MTQKKIAPYGTWKSPLATVTAFGSSEFPADICPLNGSVYATIARAAQGGRQTLIKFTPAGPFDYTSKELTPDVQINVRSTVHEYGGSPFVPVSDGVVLATLFPSNNVVLISETGPTQIILESQGKFRFAGFSVNPVDANRVSAVFEDHTIDAPSKVVSRLVVIDIAKKSFEVVREGRDFYGSAQFSADGRKLAYTTWDHPYMPWQSAELHVFDLASRTDKYIAGGLKNPENPSSTSQPCWFADNLVFLYDERGFYEEYLAKGDVGAHDAHVRPLDSNAPTYEHGDPDWTFGNSSHGHLDGTLWFIPGRDDGEIRIVDLSSKIAPKKIITGYTEHSAVRRLGPSHLVLTGMQAKGLPEIAVVNVSTATVTPIYSSGVLALDQRDISVGKSIAFPTQFPPKGAAPTPFPVPDKVVAYANIYEPKSVKYQAPEGDLPPLVVSVHGGPTAQSLRIFSYGIQLFTTRGIMVAEVNYGGSTGYGKEFRERLSKNWGIVDIVDVANLVRHLVDQKKVDPARVAITGGSAGGFTTYAALADALTRDVFTAGVAQCAVSSLSMLARDTHKFESRYLDGLLGGSIEEIPNVYTERSPLSHPGDIKAPVLILQGDIDHIVPLNQATAMRDEINASGGDAQLVVYPDEGHGFRKLETKVSAFEKTLAFYTRVWGLGEKK